jgi:hypothetical protein
LSTFLVHLSRDSTGGASARENLEAILRLRKLEARSPFGHAVSKLNSKGKSTDSQKCVCFTETPLEHVSLLGEIEGRRYDFKPYGVAITKMQGRRNGVNPVWYLDMTSGSGIGHEWRTKAVDELLEQALDSKQPFDQQPVEKLTPFIEQMGTGESSATRPRYQKEFWWEREW